MELVVLACLLHLMGQPPLIAAMGVQAERQRLAAIPGMVHPHEQAEEVMGD